MGRPQQRERDRKRSAATCQRIDSLFAPAKKRAREPSTNSTSEDLSVDDRQILPLSSAVSRPIELSNRDESEISSSLSTATGPEPCQNDTPTSHEQDSVPVAATAADSDGDHAVAAVVPQVVDIGALIENCSEQQATAKLRSLAPQEKYALLKNHSSPGPEFAFPSTFIGRCNRSFRRVWLQDNSWLAYSTVLDGGFCMPCALFSSNVSGQLVSKPFRKWNKMSECFSNHSSTKYHQDSLVLADSFTHKIENPETELPSLMDQRRAANIQKNRQLIKSIVEAILYCGKQGIALRGDNKSIDGHGNPGNLLALLKLLSLNNGLLKEHLESPGMRNATYLSPRTQNEIIDVLGNHIVL